MPAEPEVTLEQVRDILEMLRRTIEGAADLARRVETLETATKKTFDLVVTLQDHHERMMTGFERHASAQDKLNGDLARAVAQIMDQLNFPHGRGQVM